MKIRTIQRLIRRVIFSSMFYDVEKLQFKYKFAETINIMLNARAYWIEKNMLKDRLMMIYGKKLHTQQS